MRWLWSSCSSSRFPRSRKPWGSSPTRGTSSGCGASWCSSAQSYGRVVRDGIRIDFPVSHSLLADMIGSSRETVTRALDELQRSGFVARRGHTYRLLVRPECLLELARA